MPLLTPDYLTGKLFPVGFITGFSAPRVKSAWPTPVGKKLTDRKIALYKNKGKYVTNNETGETRVKRHGPSRTKKKHNIIEDLI